jgi:hypothetical protein
VKYRETVITVPGERMEIYRSGDAVGLEIHTDTGTVMWFFGCADARRIGTAIALAGRVEPVDIPRVSPTDQATLSVMASLAPEPPIAPLPPLSPRPQEPEQVLFRAIIPQGHELNTYAAAQAISATRDEGTRVLEVRLAASAPEICRPATRPSVTAKPWAT